MHRRYGPFQFPWIRVKYKSAFKKFKQTISRPKENPLGFDMGSRTNRVRVVNLGYCRTLGKPGQKSGARTINLRFTGALFNDINKTIASL